MSKKILNSLAAAAAAVAALSGAAQAQPAPSPQPAAKAVRDVVLVHGAFADGSGWRGVYENLTARGYRVSVVQNPLTSLADDVAATQRIIDRHPGPVILVGHSWGGTVITEAGNNPKVAGLVYVSALAPDSGETTAKQYEGFPPATEFVLDIGADGFGFVKPEKFKSGFAADASAADAAFLRDSQIPINMSVFATPISKAAWRTKPSWAVIAREDKAFGEGMLLHMAHRMRADVTMVPGSHALFMTQANAVADVIDRAAKGVRHQAAVTAR
ncbi:alpha/beta hydrolase [Phenylobacterium sp. J426]|uniref:alpha/beta fold hydrolase n=1 Tax=Phenylobacterium sp. J426 TaxID=2898439 RepID=UPI002151C379|nr:alpha/beta hydrolase [Phenylobacterium sp. J426]MCR5873020.1 alpha/beta hydrolase [Phenylobacterium sp. J426]